MKNNFKKKRNRQFVIWDCLWSFMTAMLVIALFDLGPEALLLVLVIYGLLIFRKIGRKAIYEWYELMEKEDKP